MASSEEEGKATCNDPKTVPRHFQAHNHQTLFHSCCSSNFWINTFCLLTHANPQFHHFLFAEVLSWWQRTQRESMSQTVLWITNMSAPATSNSALASNLAWSINRFLSFQSLPCQVALEEAITGLWVCFLIPWSEHFRKLPLA